MNTEIIQAVIAVALGLAIIAAALYYQKLISQKRR